MKPLGPLRLTLWRATLLGASLSLLRPGWSQEPAKPEGSVTPWIQELDSDSFLRREEATRKLLEQGAAVIGPLKQALRQNKPEVATRAIHILRQIIFNGEEGAQDEALQALEEIAARGDSPNARRAQEALDATGSFLAQQAIEELTDLGARIESAFPFGVPLQQQAQSIELGDDWRGTDADLRRLNRLRTVSHITLSGSKVKDDWLKMLATMPNLVRLRISRANVSSVGIAHLPKVPRLSELVLTSLPIGDEVLEHLQAIPTATDIQLYGLRVTRGGAKRLQEALPNAIIRYQGVFLGITSPRGPNWSITAVEPGTPAARGGLEVGDVITRFGDHEVREFEELQTHIASADPGDVVMLEIRRGNQTLTKRIQF